MERCTDEDGDMPTAGPGGPDTLSLWKTHGPGSLGMTEAEDLARAIRGSAILRDPHWPAARSGESAAAVAAAIARIRSGRLEGPAAGLVMGNLLLLASRGDPAAALVLGHGVRMAWRPRRAGAASKRAALPHARSGRRRWERV